MGNKYAFYDIGKACTRGVVDHARSPSSSPFAKKTVYTTSTGGPTKTTFGDIFSGPTKTAIRSSRRDLSHRIHMKTIAGVKVPSRPSEPGDKDCCMSGCVNCVWELFNADLEDWKYKRHQAVTSLLKGKPTDEQWPSNWEAPPKDLPIDYIPNDYKSINSHLKVETINEEAAMPVGMAVFAAFQKKLKQRHLKSQ